MKLWMKISGLALMVVMLTVGACLYLFTALQGEETLRLNEESALARLAAMAVNVRSVEDVPLGNASAITARSVVQYSFSSYAAILQEGSTGFSLVREGEYLFHTGAYDVYGYLRLPENAQKAWTTVEAGGRMLLVACQGIRVLSQAYVIYGCFDVTQTYARLDSQTRVAQWLLLLSAACVLALLPLFVRRALKSVAVLKAAAERIAGGEYALRTGIASGDEIGALSASFDQMAQAVETQVGALQDVAERRKLMLGALTHELKTPMTAIIGYADSILHMPLDEEKKQYSLAQISLAGKRTERLSQKLMALISLEENEAAAEMKWFSGKAFLQEIKTAFPGIDTLCRSERLWGDRDLLFSLARNLIDNALKASPRGEAVLLEIDGDGESARLSVIDHGCGIPPEHLAQVTEPFYRVDKARSRKLGGAGLGLTLCELICKAHGGRLDIKSVVGAGTIISAVWPQRKEGACHEA